MALRSVKKWSKYVNKSLAGQSKSFLRKRTAIQRRLANDEIPRERAEKEFADLKASVRWPRASARDDRLYNRIVIDTAIKEFGFNKTLSPSALRNLHQLTQQVLQRPRDRQAVQTLDRVSKLLGDKELTKRFFRETVSLRRAYNESD
ncbi:MAG: hypothetical protein Q7R47_06170 [Candidatus Diapherotrites archaeon]|nr:hypothetical protein [Candidatus Diapherotrites archaeon]